jgi:hypothetical protein
MPFEFRQELGKRSGVICFLGGLLEGLVEEIGEGRKGGVILVFCVQIPLKLSGGLQI